MAVVGIVMKFFQIVISIAVGMAAGCIPVVGYNVGAGRNDRVKALFTRLLIGEFTVGAIALIIVEFFPRQLIGIFGAANESQAYSHILDDGRQNNAALFQEAFYEKGTSSDEIPQDKLAKLLSNPEVVALLKTLAKTIGQ